MAKYSIVIQWSDEDMGYIAIVPEFPSLSAFGETPEEATKELMAAQEALIEVYEEDGCELPEPDILRGYSGQTRLRIEKTLHSRLAFEAKKEGISLNTHISNILERRHNLPMAENKIASLVNALSSLKSEITAIRSDIRNIKATIAYYTLDGLTATDYVTATTNVFTETYGEPVSNWCMIENLNQ